MKRLEDWYQNNLIEYDSLIAQSTYCEQVKVNSQKDDSVGNATSTYKTSYTPNFKCETDGNSKGELKLKIGLITLDEVLMAGVDIYGIKSSYNTNVYLFNNAIAWTMSPAGYSDTYGGRNDGGNGGARSWILARSYATCGIVSNDTPLRPVINILPNTKVSGEGTSTNPWTIE